MLSNALFAKHEKTMQHNLMQDHEGCKKDKLKSV
jgi:hypothetical protein